MERVSVLHSVVVTYCFELQILCNVFEGAKPSPTLKPLYIKGFRNTKDWARDSTLESQ